VNCDVTEVGERFGAYDAVDASSLTHLRTDHIFTNVMHTETDRLFDAPPKGFDAPPQGADVNI